VPTSAGQEQLDRAITLVGLALTLVSVLANTVQARLVGLAAIVVAFATWRITRRYRGIKWAVVLLVLGVVALAAAGPKTVRNAAAGDPRPHLLLSLDGRNVTRDALTWSPKVDASQGETVDFLLTVDNGGESVLHNIVVRVIPPPHLDIVEDSVSWIAASQGEVPAENAPLFGGGYNYGNFAPGGGFYVRFTAVVDDDFEECQVVIRALAFAGADEVQEREAPVDISIARC
jgi:uncharacterized repeat protein (TIGR01451 family)